MKFNLNKFIKEAMGAPTWRYRSEIKWSRLEEAVKGTPIASIESDINDPNSVPKELTWSELKTKNENGVRSALYEILNWREKTLAKFKSRYKLNNSKLKDLFQVYVGYHPFYGLYMCSVGPYYAGDGMWNKMSKIADGREIDNEFLDTIINDQLAAKDSVSAARSVKADINNRFGFFTKRHQRATQKEIQKSAMNYIKDTLDELSKIIDTSDVEIGLDDLQLVLKKATGDSRGTTQISKSETVYNGLGENSPDAKTLFRDTPILGAESEIKIKPNVLSNIILKCAKSGNWQNIYNEALYKIARKSIPTKSKKGLSVITDDMVRAKVIEISNALQDSSFDGAKIMEQVLKFSHEIRQEMISKGDVNAELLKIPSSDFKIMKGQGAGTAMPTTLGIKADQYHLAELRTEILDAIAKSGTEDPKKIAEILNSEAKREKVGNIKAKGKITEQEVEQFIIRCKKERKVRVKGQFAKQKSYEQLANESKTQLEDLRNALNKKDLSGFNNIEEAFVMACLSLASPGSDAIDPQTKAHISSTFMPPPDLFTRGEDFVNYTSQQLIETRRNKKDADELLGTIRIASPKDIEREIGVTENENPDIEETEETEEIESPIEDIPVDEPMINEIDAPINQEPEQIDQPIEDFPITELPQQAELLNAPVNPTEVQNNEVSQIPQEINPIEEDSDKKANRRKKTNPVDLSKVVSNSLGTLIKVAKDLDNKGKYDASEEVHKIIRKYQKGL